MNRRPAPPRSSVRRLSRRPAAALVAAVLLVVVTLLSGCTAMAGAREQARAGDDKGYVAGDGSVTEFAPDQRGEPITVSGAGTDGQPLSSADLRGKVVVLNLWYAACGPCRDEAPDLAAIATDNATEVQFVGINTRDDEATAQAFEKTFAIPYPSIVDNQGTAVLALRGVATPNAVPTTLVLDRQGRVSARLAGRADPSTLRALIATAVAEPA